MGVEQHGQQDPGGGGEQHTQAGHIGPDWRPTHTHIHTSVRSIRNEVLVMNKK